MMATDTLRGQADIVVVYYADMPLLKPATIQTLIDAQERNTGAVTLLTVTQDDPRGFGRIIRNNGESVIDIVEESVATDAQLAIRELNAGVYAFDADWLWSNLPALLVRSKGEYFLTDLVPLAASQGMNSIGISTDDLDEVVGINTRIHLADAEAALRRRVNRALMLSGVTLQDPASTYIHEDVEIGQDTVILANTHIYGSTRIGSQCVIGPNTTIVGSKIGANCEVEASVIEHSELEDHVDIGPFSHLRRGAYLEEGVHLGNFGEVKNARLGKRTHMGHFSYIGDAEIAEDVNIGAGTITCNFDGVRKNKTIIGRRAFIGSDTMLIAPITVGNDARTGAGSVVTKNVPDNHLAVGVPARMRRNRPVETEQKESDRDNHAS
jgi:bifunctional UDP-N-acetylglucosamine pyrophosphorylase/glucosamine-1-phosphate N-acetyltransferase